METEKNEEKNKVSYIASTSEISNKDCTIID